VFGSPLLRSISSRRARRKHAAPRPFRYCSWACCALFVVALLTSHDNSSWAGTPPDLIRKRQPASLERGNRKNPPTCNSHEKDSHEREILRNLTFFSLVRHHIDRLCHAGWAAGHEGVFGSSGGLAADTPQAQVGRPGGQVGSPEAEWAPADLSRVGRPLTTIAEACITGTRRIGQSVLRFNISL